MFSPIYGTFLFHSHRADDAAKGMDFRSSHELTVIYESGLLTLVRFHPVVLSLFVHALLDISRCALYCALIASS
jgi:hypothetical protein